MTSTLTTDVIELQPFPIIAFPNSSWSKDISKLFNNHSENRETINPLNAPDNASVTPSMEERPLSKLQLAMTILQPSLVNFFGSFTSGIITVGLPIIASSISLQCSIYLWPSSVYSLTSGATLLIAGSAADIIGARRVEVCGIFLLSIFILSCGFSQTGTQLVVFRALQGIALAMHIPASVSIIASAVPAGRARNIGFGCLGLSQPLGFSFGTVLSGIMIERIGWRSGFYLSGAAILTAAAVSWFTLPKVKPGAESLTMGDLLKKLRKEVDWIGGTLAGSGLALLAYVLAMVSADLSIIRSTTTASLLAASLVLIVGSSIMCALAPLMMALVNPNWKYYYLELWAQMLAPLSTNVLFTVGLIIVSDNFPEKTQALAGAVFSTASQFDTSLGVGVCQMVALGVMGSDVNSSGDPNSATSGNARDMLRGYRAGFWTMFASMVCCVLIAIVGLRQTGKVGLKKD